MFVAVVGGALIGGAAVLAHDDWSERHRDHRDYGDKAMRQQIDDQKRTVEQAKNKLESCKKAYISFRMEKENKKNNAVAQGEILLKQLESEQASDKAKLEVLNDTIDKINKIRLG